MSTPRPGCVFVTVQLPRELADLLAERRGDFMAIMEMVGRECERLPDTAEAEAETERRREQKEQERLDKLIKIGRFGFRLLRHRIKTESYLNFDGVYQTRSAQLSNAQWRRIVITDIAKEFGEPFVYVEFAIARFKKDLLSKIIPRRNQTIIRLYLSGSSNAEIAKRVGVSTTSVSKFLRDNKEHIRNLFKALPETDKPLKGNKRGALPGKSQSVHKKAPEKSPGESN